MKVPGLVVFRHAALPVSRHFLARRPLAVNIRAVAMLSSFKARQQGAGAGTVYIAASFAASGALTFAFQAISTRALGGAAGYAPVALLWSAVFLAVQVLWVAATQTLGRHVAEREARGEGWRPVVSSVRRWQGVLVAAFLLAALPAGPLLTEHVFGDAWLTAAFVAAVAFYAPEYFRRGVFNGHRQPFRLGAQILAESSGRVLVAAVLLALGWGVLGPALAIVLAPLVGFLAVGPASVAPPERDGGPFGAAGAFRFAGPVLACGAFAQALMNGGPILASVLGATDAQVGLLGAALVLTRVPQYVLTPAIGALLPHASRILSAEGRAAFDRFVVGAVAAVGIIGMLMVGGTWLLGGWALRLFAGPGFEASRGVLVALAMLAAFYLVSETLNQALFALGRERLAALAWFVGLPVCAVCLAVLGTGIVERISYSLAIGALAAAAAQAICYLATRGRPGPRA